MRSPPNASVEGQPSLEALLTAVRGCAGSSVIRGLSWRSYRSCERESARWPRLVSKTATIELESEAAFPPLSSVQP